MEVLIFKGVLFIVINLKPAFGDIAVRLLNTALSANVKRLYLLFIFVIKRNKKYRLTFMTGRERSLMNQGDKLNSP